MATTTDETRERMEARYGELRKQAKRVVAVGRISPERGGVRIARVTTEDGTDWSLVSDKTG